MEVEKFAAQDATHAENSGKLRRRVQTAGTRIAEVKLDGASDILRLSSP